MTSIIRQKTQSRTMKICRYCGIPMLLVILLLAFGSGGGVVSAAELSEAELFFELNNTDGDLGIHGSIDGGPYVLLKIKDPNDKTLMILRAKGRLQKQGLTQLFFESAEPQFNELPPDKFFSRFPEGTYEISAKTNDGEELVATVDLSQVMAAPVGNVTINGQPAAANCDAVPLPLVNEPVVIDWDPVMQSHPTIGKPGPVVIERYQFFVEQGDLKFSADLIPDTVDVTQFQVPSEIFALGDKTQPFKFEIIARTDAGNNTAIENCFMVQP